MPGESFVAESFVDWAEAVKRKNEKGKRKKAAQCGMPNAECGIFTARRSAIRGPRFEDEDDNDFE